MQAAVRSGPRQALSAGPEASFHLPSPLGQVSCFWNLLGRWKGRGTQRVWRLLCASPVRFRNWILSQKPRPLTFPAARSLCIPGELLRGALCVGGRGVLWK